VNVFCDVDRWPLVYGLHLLCGDTAKPLSHLHSLNRSAPLYQRCTRYYKAFCDVLGIDGRTCSPQLFDHLLAVCDVNEWGVSTAHPSDAVYNAGDGRTAGDGTDSMAVGTGARMGLFSSLFNHSCTPNVTMLDSAGGEWPPSTAEEGHRLVPRVTEDVEAGTELFVSYVDSSEVSVSERTRKLASYGFKCMCDRCAEEAEGEELTPAALAALDKYGIRT
jgi:hypothetical protein